MDTLPSFTPSGRCQPRAPDTVAMEMTPPVGRAGSPAEWQEAERKGWYRVWGVSAGGLGDAVPGCTRWLGAGGQLVPQGRSPQLCQGLPAPPQSYQKITIPAKSTDTQPESRSSPGTGAAVPLILDAQLQSREKDSSVVSKPPGRGTWLQRPKRMGTGCSYP